MIHMPYTARGGEAEWDEIRDVSSVEIQIFILRLKNFQHELLNFDLFFIAYISE